MDRRRFLALSIWFVAASAHAQVDRFHTFIALDNNSRPIPGACLYSFEAGGSIPKSVYSSITPTPIHHPNPVMMNSRGHATIYLGPGQYKFMLVRPAKGYCDAVRPPESFATGEIVWIADNVYESPESRALRQRLGSAGK